MKTISKFFLLPLLLVAISCSTETVTDSTEDINAITLKGKRKGNCDVYKERPSRNSYVGDPGGVGTYSGTWGYPVGDYTGQSVITGFEFNEDFTGATQTSIDEVTAENGDTFVTISTVLIVFTNPEGSTGTYTVDFTVDGGTGIFEEAKGSFRVKNGVFDETGAYHNAIGKITSLGLCVD